MLPKINLYKKESKLTKPSLKLKDSYIESIKEFHQEGRYIDLSIDYLENNFEMFLSEICNEEKGVGLKDGYVPATVLWLENEDGFIGRVSIRHSLTKELLNRGGHIGYDIRPSLRNRGYGSEILKLVLPIAKGLGIEKILITCADNNIGSCKIIEKNGGILENKIKENEVVVRRYWINQ
ncbi:MAG: GNAT family N-acetyltransferase [bacterium]